MQALRGPAEVQFLRERQERFRLKLHSIAGQPGSTETLVALLTCIERVSEVPVGELHDLAASLDPEAKEAHVTTAEMLQAEGAAKGAAQTKAPDVLKVIDVRNLRTAREQRAMVTEAPGWTS